MKHAPFDRHMREAAAFFGGAKGFFVEVGANDPHKGSQTWHLEQAGWRGILVEPQPNLAERLRVERSAKVYPLACSSPQNAGRTLPLHVAGPMSSLDRAQMAPGAIPDAVIEVPVTTLDAILVEAAAPVPLDFVSIDVEGHEIDVLAGFDMARWRPRLVLLEDHVANLDKYRAMRAAGYRLIRHAEFNGWYVPDAAAVAVPVRDRWEMLRKYFLGLPFRFVRNALRRLKQPLKDRRALRNGARRLG